jgi:hypothetical protein
VADWHLRELERELARRGWRIEAVLPGDDYRVSASWKITRGDAEHFLDFQGLDDLETLPLDEAYGVDIRGREGGLYFGKRPSETHPSRHWPEELQTL